MDLPTPELNKARWCEQVAAKSQHDPVGPGLASQSKKLNEDSTGNN